MPTTNHLPDADYDLITALWRELGQCGAGIVPTRLPINCEADDFRAVTKDLEVLARKVDALVAAYGGYINRNTSYKVELDLFDRPLAKALEGNALYEIECAADQADEEILELAEAG